MTCKNCGYENKLGVRYCQRCGQYPDISDYMYSINVTSYRVAEDDELGLEGKMPTVEIVSK